VSPTPARLVVLLHSGEYDRIHQGLSIAAAAVAQERPVEVYFFWWALERLLRDALDEPDFGPAPSVLEAEVADRFERRGMPTLRTLLGHLRESGLCTVLGCTGSLAALGREAEAAGGPVDLWVGWSAILQRTAGVVDRFYL
jgi:peroxiredoxin family protein